MNELRLKEERRLAALRRLDILDTPREKAYDDIVLMASHLFEVPISLVSLIERDRQWFKACVGLSVDQTSRDVSFCNYAIGQDDLNQVFVVPDASADSRFNRNPLVTGPPHIRMYAGAPLVTKEGEAVGSLCIIDIKPREPTPRQLDALKVLARSVVAHMELRRGAEELRESEERHRLIIDTAMDAVITVDHEGHVAAWNQRAETIFGWPASEAIGRAIGELIGSRESKGDENSVVSALLAAGKNPEPNCGTEVPARRRDGSIFPAEIIAWPLKTRDGWMRSAFVRDITERKRQQDLARQTETRDVAIFALAKLAESRDPETGAHLERVQNYCQILAEKLAAMGKYTDKIDAEYVRLLYSTSPLHDIGKVGIPDGVLLKPGRLSDREFEIMKTHTAIGAETLDAALERFPGTPFLTIARNIAATHHERFDGTGYPDGLAGQDIPLCGRIVAVADVFDALSSKRIYKAAFAHDVVMDIMTKESGSHFDPAIIAAFEACEDEFTAIRERFAPRYLVEA